MALAPGTRLGPYEITGPLGAGGMGEVYRARDRRLDRDVAVKVLAPELAAGPVAADGRDSSRARDDRRGRFEREAKAIAALAHPHICTLYDIGHEGDIEYLVMELLEGTDLAARLARGALPVPEAVACAVQIADALVAAHRLGIVHRDLKPANIMLVRSGAGRGGAPHVKLLDFGLAKLREEQAGRADPVGGRTMTAPLTGQGQIIGTLNYMAPEQLEGRPVDARADIFAFGTIVFEMITGRRAFAGGSAAGVIGAILREPVPPISQVVPAAPPALDRVVEACLAKDPEDRWSSAHDVLLQLRAMAGNAETAASPVGSTDTRSASTASASSWRPRLAWPLGLLVAAALGAAAGAWLVRPAAVPALPGAAAVDRVSILPPDGTALQRGEAPEISPDGRQIAFIATDGSGRNVIYVRSRDSLAARALPGTEDATLPFWAPDGGRLGFFAGGQLKTVALAGGTPQVIAPAPVARGGTWSREDRILFVGTPSEPPMIVAASGGDVAPVPVPPVPRAARWHPVFLPDGRHYLFLTSQNPTDRVPFAAHVGTIDSPESRELVKTLASVAYAEPGYLLFRRRSTLMAQRLDPSSFELRGAALELADDAGYNSVTYQGLFSASADGVLVYQSSTPSSQLAWFDPRGIRTGVVAPPADYNALCLTGDGRRIVFDLADPESGAVDLWWADVEGGTPSRLTFDRAVDFYPVCDPAGQSVLFASLRDGPPNLYRVPLSAPGTETPLLRSPVPKVASDWARNGIVLFSVLNRGTGWDIGMLPAAGAEPTLLVHTPADERNGRLSPDGRWMAYVSNESGTAEVYAQPFPATGARWQISRGGGAQPQWRGDGRALFYLAQDRRLMEVPAGAAGTQLAVGEPRALFQTRMTAHEPTNPCCQYAAVGDGARFVVTTATDNALPITLVRSWPALLRP
jgi:serine/threonine protein kinase